MKQKIALHGSYYMDNFGDTLFVVFFYNWLKKINGVENEDIILPFANNRVRRLVDVSKEKGLNGLLKSDKVVFFGGGYLGERPHRKISWNIRLIAKHLSVGLIAVLFNKPYIFIGVGAGPLTNFISRKIVVFLCNRSEKVIVRDKESEKYLEEYGVKKEKLQLSVDSILSLQEKDVDSEWNQKYESEFKQDELTNTTYVGIHLQMSSRESGNLKKITKDISKFCNDLENYRIIIFNDTYTKKPDETVYNLLLESIDEDKIQFIEYKNPDQLIALINNLDIVITSKLHCGIVANCLGKYTVSISVHSKTTRLYRQLNLGERQVLIEDYEEGCLLKMLSDYGTETKDNNVPIHIQKLALNNKDELLKFVKY